MELTPSKLVKKVLKIQIVILASLGLIFLSGCKKTFSEPPATGAPQIVANTTIKDLKALYDTIGQVVPITDNIVISGVVNMDDRSGNYYQQISIQDETGGIILRLAGSNHNTNYPVGRRVYVICKGLALGDFGRMIQLGGGLDTINGGVTLLAPNLHAKHIIPGALNQPLVPKTVTVAQLGTSPQDPYVNTLIKLENMEFAPADTAKNYADVGASASRILQGCTSPGTNRITVRTSNFANFATLPVPNGGGSVTGIYSLFGATKQLTLRDTNDVMLNGPRCSTSGGGGGGGGPIGGATIDLTGTGPYLINFNNIDAGLPSGISISMNGTASSLGTAATYTSAKSLWGSTSAGFKNFASANGLTSSASNTDQDNSADRALGVRQTSTASTGGDPGASFIFLISNTTGKSNLKMDFKLQSLDVASGRTTTWTLEYALGDNPTSFTTVTTGSTLTTGGTTFSNTPVSVNLPTALNNQSQKVWLRLIARTAATGSGNRASSAIDDVQFSWN